MGSTTRWAITAQHCLGSTNDSTAYSVVLQDGTSVGVEWLYPHPLAEWGLTGFDLGDGENDGTGKVDMMLIRLDSDVDIDAADRNFYFSTANTSLDTYQESKNGGFTWVQASMSPHSSWPVRAVNYAGTQGGDSGGPIWKKSSIDSGARLYEGLHSSAGNITDSSSFYEWAIDSMYCGVFNVNDIDWSFCSAACPCGVGEGDCDSDADCKSGLVCRQDHGNRVGGPSTLDVCLETTSTVHQTSGWCEANGGCQLYEGDFNTHAGCKDNLVCRKDVGAAVGASQSTDICDMPRVPEWKGTNRSMDGSRLTESSNYCTTSSPCSLGDGDCDSSNHDTTSWLLEVQGVHVGHQFGFSNNLVDVRVHPLYY